MFMAESNIGHKICRPGDLVINTMWAWMAALGGAKQPGLVSPSYAVYRPRPGSPLLPRYTDYLLRTHPYASEYLCLSTGIRASRLRMYPDQFLRIPLACPPVEEQQAILEFLSTQDRLFQNFIRNRRRLIEVLNEQKQVIIDRAITRGLDPDVRLKASGIYWLGDVPGHWELKRFKFLARVTSGQVDPRIIPYCNYILIAPNHIERGTGKLLAQETADSQGASSGKYVVASGQVIYSKIRPALRKATIAPTDCLCSADMYAISPVSEVLRPRFLLMLLLSGPASRYLIDCSMRVAMPKVNREALGNCWLWYPRVVEQDFLIEKLSQLLAPLEAAVDRVRREIELVREYRNRLVADVITGKLDVRHLTVPAAARLSEGFELLDNSELIDDDTQSTEATEEFEEVADADD